MPVRLVILDRDGVINHDSDEFIKSVAEWRPIDGSIEAIARLSRAGFTISIASNQSGVGRGLLNLATLGNIHDTIRQRVAEAGGTLGEIVFCPHLPDQGCDCRKPRPGLLLQLAQHYGIDLQGVPFVGDSLRDLEAAHAAGAMPILVRTGNGATTEQRVAGLPYDVGIFNDLGAFAGHLIARDD